MGPPPHLEALLLITTTVMMIGGFAARWIAHGGDDDVDTITIEDLQVDPEAAPNSSGVDDVGERSVLIRHSIGLHEKKHLLQRGSLEGIQAGTKAM